MQDSKVQDADAFLATINNELQSQARNSQRRKIADKIQPITSFIQRHSVAAVPIAHFAPPPSRKFLLGGMKGLLDLPEGYIKFQESIADTLALMGQALDVAAQYSETYRNVRGVRERLIEVYIDIFDFCGATLCLLSKTDWVLRSTGKTVHFTMGGTFDTSFGPLKQKFERDYEFLKTIVDSTSKHRAETFYKDQKDNETLQRQNYANIQAMKDKQTAEFDAARGREDDQKKQRKEVEKKQKKRRERRNMNLDPCYLTASN